MNKGYYKDLGTETAVVNIWLLFFCCPVLYSKQKTFLYFV